MNFLLGIIVIGLVLALFVAEMSKGGGDPNKGTGNRTPGPGW